MESYYDDEMNGEIDYVIGIDPGVDTGVAVMNLNLGVIEEVYSMKIHAAMDFVDGYVDSSLIVVEDARLWNGYRRGITAQEMRVRQQGAGSVKRDCAIWEDYLKEAEAFFVLLAPSAKGRKISHAEFKMFTGWSGGTTNQHKRDAAMLAFPYKRPVVDALYREYVKNQKEKE